MTALVPTPGAAAPIVTSSALLVLQAALSAGAKLVQGQSRNELVGRLVGATLWKQQIMQVVGVLAGAVVIGPVLGLLQAKYGIGEVTADHPHPLSAPQATLMAGPPEMMQGKRMWITPRNWRRFRACRWLCCFLFRISLYGTCVRMI